MSLEEKIDALTKAITENTEALLATQALAALNEGATKLLEATKEAKKPKAKKQDKKVEEVQAEKQETYTPPEAPAEAPVIDYERVRTDAGELLIKVGKADRPKAITLLKKYGIKALSELSDEKIVAFYGDLVTLANEIGV